MTTKAAPLSLFTLFFAGEAVSINAMYTVVRGRQILTSEGRRFKAQLTSAVATQLPFNWGVVVDDVFKLPCFVELSLVFYSPELHNKSWVPGGRTKSNARSLPYQRMDTSNYVKIVEDAIAAATGIDDSLHRTCSHTREVGEQGIGIYYSVWQDLNYGK